MEVLKALVDDGTHGSRIVKRVGVEERVGGEAWHGSVAVITSPTSSKKNRGSPFKQVSRNYRISLLLCYCNLITVFNHVR